MIFRRHCSVRARTDWRWPTGLLACCFLFVVVTPATVHAHGELDIQIATKTRQIEAATNNLAQLYLQRGELYREHNDWEAALADCDRAAQFGVGRARVDFLRANVLAESGRLDAARGMFDAVLAHDASNGEAWVGRARVLVKQGQSEAAVTDFRQGLELLKEPKPEYFLEVAQVLMVLQRTNEALQSLDTGIKKFGPIVLLQSYALDIEASHKRYDAALARLDTIIEGAQRKETWLARRGDILLEADRPAEARATFEAALAAIGRLPVRLQEAPPMQNLQSRIHAALGTIKNP